MIDKHTQGQEFRKAIRYQTDPQWYREQHGHPHQYSAFQCIGLLICGLACVGILVAIGSI